MKTKISTIALIAIVSISSHLVAQEGVVAAQEQAVKGGWDQTKNMKCRVSPTEMGLSVSFEHYVKVPVDNVGKPASGKKGFDYYQANSEYIVNSSDNSVTEVTSPRDAASGMATGKRMHQPISVTKDVDKSTPVIYEEVSGKVTSEDTWTEGRSGGGAAGKAVFKELTITKRCGGINEKYTLLNDEAVIPTGDCPNGNCALKITWTWQDGSIDNTDWVVSKKKTGVNSANFILAIEDGVCTAMAINEKGLPGDKKPNKKAIVPKN